MQPLPARLTRKRLLSLITELPPPPSGTRSVRSTHDSRPTRPTGNVHVAENARHAIPPGTRPVQINSVEPYCCCAKSCLRSYLFSRLVAKTRRRRWGKRRPSKAVQAHTSGPHWLPLRMLNLSRSAMVATPDEGLRRRGISGAHIKYLMPQR